MQRWGSMEALLVALDSGDPAVTQRPKLEAARDYLAVASDVTRVRTDCPLPTADDRLPTEAEDPERLVELVDRWGVESSVNRLLTAIRGVQAGS